MRRYFSVWFKAHRVVASEPMLFKGYIFATDAEAIRTLGQLRSGHPSSSVEGFWLYDIAGKRWYPS